jgi:hypothetical protein
MAFSFNRLLIPAALLGFISSGLTAAEAPPQAIVFTGMCDASAAAAIDAERFVVADDEDNILRVYSRAGGGPLSEFDLSEFLEVQGKKKAKETDLEAATQIGGHTFWITSHGRNSKGKDKPERQRLFATETRVVGSKVEIAPIGEPYSALLDDLLADERLARYDLKSASQLAPKATGGLNIEGLAATPEGHLLIGFRNPVRDKRLLVVPLLNPLEIVKGGRAKLGAPIELALQGVGIRSIERVGNRYVIIAGATGEGGEPSRLFEWDGKEQPKPIAGVTLRDLNPEGVAFIGKDGESEYLILSDDGSRTVGGQDCKDLKDPSLKSFRGRVVKF